MATSYEAVVYLRCSDDAELRRRLAHMLADAGCEPHEAGGDLGLLPVGVRLDGDDASEVQLAAQARVGELLTSSGLGDDVEIHDVTVRSGS